MHVSRVLFRYKVSRGMINGLIDPVTCARVRGGAGPPFLQLFRENESFGGDWEIPRKENL